MLRLDQLGLRRGPRLLFTETTFALHTGERVGVTGANGSGKSSLFALILDELHADAGELHYPKDWVVAHVAQETPSDLRPAIEYVLDGDQELRQIEQALLRAEESPQQGELLATLHSQLDSIDGYSARSRAARLLHGLGFSAGEENHPVDHFSGGWRMRLNLARALMCRSDLLLLDEPTNHLDLDAVIWLEAWLKMYSGTLLLISHDRDFLDAVTTHIAHIERGRFTLYSGNYSAFEHVRAERLAHQQASFTKQQQEIAHIRSYVERFRAKATKARQAQSRLKALQRMELIAPAHVDSPFQFSFKLPKKNPRPLLRLESAATGYGDTTILQGIDLTLVPGDRIGLLGHNGAGKSTLIKLLAESLPLTAGERHHAQDLAIGYFAQHQMDQLRPEHTPLEHLQQLDRKASEQECRNYLGNFGFSGELIDHPTAPFSGGEKARLVLALLIYQRPNLLLLDEPTNHLDLEMRHSLSQALQDFVGAMVIVSHDRHLLRTCTDQLFIVNRGGIEEFKGDLDDYPRWLADNHSDKKSNSNQTTTTEQSAATRRERKRQEAEQRQQLKPLRQTVARLEKELADLTQTKVELEQQLAATEIYSDQKKPALKLLLKEKSQLDAALATTEEGWLKAVEELEQCNNQPS